MATVDTDRKTEIVELVDLMGIEEADVIVKGIPNASSDQDDAVFEEYYAFVQLVAMVSSASVKEKCDILKDILLLNKKFQLELHALSYFERICRGK